MPLLLLLSTISSSTGRIALAAPAKPKSTKSTKAAGKKPPERQRTKTNVVPAAVVVPKPPPAPVPAVAPATWAAPGADETPTKEWRGERFAKKFGGVFVALGVQKLAGAKGRVSEVRVTFSDAQKKQTHLMRLDPNRTSSSPPGQYFISPSGKYTVSRIEVIDGAGVKRTWTGGGSSFKFAVKSHCLSNLGRWTFGPEGADRLAISFESAPNNFRELGRSRDDSSVAAVIDGATGSVQDIYAGKRALLLAAAGPGSESPNPPSSAGSQEQLSNLRLNEWHGEYFDKNRGAFFVSLSMQNFRGGFTSDVQVYLTDILRSSTVMISLDPNRQPTSVAGQIWAASTGKYRVDKIELVDATGAKRTWVSNADQNRYAVKRQCLSNLGRWTVKPQGADGLAVTFESIANPFKEQGKERHESSVAAVIDGKTGLVQEVFAGKKAISSADNDNSTTNELRRSITFTRQIVMFYKLDLMRHNYHAKTIAEVLNAHDATVRRCYTDRLDFNDNLRGTLNFTFLLSKQTGTMAKLKHTGGSANDPKLAECVYLALSSMQFPVPDNMVGQLIYTYDVK